jgi:hypothetical protein
MRKLTHKVSHIYIKTMKNNRLAGDFKKLGESKCGAGAKYPHTLHFGP